MDPLAHNYCPLVLSNEELEFLGFQVDTFSNLALCDLTSKLFIIDCEMVKTTLGQEVVALCLIDQNKNVIIDELIKPVGEIVDYVTHITGFTKETFKTVTTSISDVITKLYEYVQEKDILAGHDIFSDINAITK